ncbi:TetR/AcrR family transcriptional regulator [Sandaracinus amylolyticus]|uniref:Transcriptional regulator, TetR family protein n=1 Tax=Sandaracinus amylolyticus TaxID=927083 RepID=A0A0F6YLQ7_9BACT|nr:TetR/AcrR family transcriptional regulator [Sandaracinus amylolyticus]AKF09463.1 Transcriptional regulator, TetR family protein [Sandaracinus amylolyticus]
MTPPRSDPDTGKRDVILDAALELFAERGFHGTAVPLVAERAKVGAGTIYRYFESKEHLVNALYRREKQRMTAALADGFPFDQPPREQFHVLFERAIAFMKGNAISVRFLELHHHAAYLDAESRALEEHGNALVEAAFRASIAQLAMRDLPPALLVAIVWGVFDGLLRAWSEGRLELSPAVVAQAEQCCWEAIRR